MFEREVKLEERNAIRSLDARAPVVGRVLLESDLAQDWSLEGRPLDMYASLRLPDRSRLRLSNPRRQSAPHSANGSDPMSGRNKRREPA